MSIISISARFLSSFLLENLALTIRNISLPNVVIWQYQK